MILKAQSFSAKCVYYNEYGVLKVWQLPKTVVAGVQGNELSSDHDPNRCILLETMPCDTEGIRTPAGRAQWISSPSPSPLGHSVLECHSENCFGSSNAQSILLNVYTTMNMVS